MGLHCLVMKRVGSDGEAIPLTDEDFRESEQVLFTNDISQLTVEFGNDESAPRIVMEKRDIDGNRGIDIEIGAGRGFPVLTIEWRRAGIQVLDGNQNRCYVIIDPETAEKISHREYDDREANMELDMRATQAIKSACQHDPSEDCMNCGKCGKCSEELNDDDACPECLG